MSAPGTDVNSLLADAKARMAKSVEACSQELATVRTGRASPALLDRVTVDYYGAPTPLRQLANVAAPEPRLLTIQPYDRSSIAAIERAINESDLGLTPSNDGTVIRLVLPELTQERRQELVKVVKGLAEEAKVAVRNVRRDILHALRERKQAAELSEDDERHAEAELQKLTDRFVGEIDQLLKRKEAEILER